MKNRSLKRLLSYFLTAALAFGLGVFALACVLRPRVLNVNEIDLSQTADGEYFGVCQNKILFAVVRVQVENHSLRSVEVLAHKPSYLTQAQEACRRAVEAQSTQVDAVTGATLTATTVLKAVENALN